VSVLAPALCEKLALQNRRGEWDLYDQHGRPATICRNFKGEHDSFNSHLLYLREELAAEYLSPDRELLWFVWGERNFHYKSFDSNRDAFSGHSHIHRYSHRWAPTSR